MKELPALVNAIINGIQEKKGQKIVVADLREIDGTIASYFVICQGNSPTQVEAITDAVIESARKEVKEKPLHIVGLGTSQWVAIDFNDTFVHIFLPEPREFYDLENLWQDAKMTQIPDLD